QGDASAPYGKKHYGRVRDNVKKGNQKKVVLWEFIRGLLLNGNTTIIKWENKQEGVFRIINSQKVAQLWGKHKQNPAMNYDKLARAM
ncbi:PREDICTED: ETS homologous factor-like, partial [Priapulus caudatus]|uniref:ETS homologous factor-like n=1 Tax=Priapulus caudatus TaxID=37621 RepID=A0ABM1F7C0_PRICU